MTDRAAGRAPRWPVVAALAGLAVAVQLWGLYRVAGPPTPGWFPHADKVGHALVFAAPVALLLVALGLRARVRGSRRTPRPLVAVVAVFVTHAVVSEVVQGAFYASRSGDPLDVVADCAGVAVGALVAVTSLRRATDRTPVLGRSRPQHSRAGTP